MIPRLKPWITWSDWKAAFSFFSGNAVSEFENKMASQFGRKHGVMFSHGRSALFALLKAWDLKDAEVICPAYTCVVVPHAIVLSGNTPRFVDSENAGFNMDLLLLSQAINDKTRAIVVTHLFGQAMDVVAVQNVVEQAEQRFGNKIYVIQDCAHSYDCEFDGRSVTHFGDAVFFGSNIGKLITSIFGGTVLVDDVELFKRIMRWRSEHGKKDRLKPFKRFAYLFAVSVAFSSWFYPVVQWLDRKGLLGSLTHYYDELKIEFPADWDAFPCSIEARVGLSQLERYSAIIQSRRTNAQIVLTMLQQNAPDPIQHYFTAGATYSHLALEVSERDHWGRVFQKNGIELGILVDYAIPVMPVYQPFAGGEQFPNALRMSKSMINIPIWPQLDVDKLTYRMNKALQQLYKQQ
ncbi:DegT/DnrJ/EryC1/StrS family aminotransferase [Neptunicella marina]|uniref:DegT/DnrJ/EryC1/StrS aminotransferase family protein n=1 Tax=Neptunicella marina TaxID=2125989 RepID=A0A8J6IT96_9ALTE|nr:DegT/DnrJ/EryC1/StrS aminotransferase family protein [Neptunicella marina]MBC3765013.1 DegT/DnrJ/EryC1/StrS aminotransferase family protein [Neptunicella marina]